MGLGIEVWFADPLSSVCTVYFICGVGNGIAVSIYNGKIL